MKSALLILLLSLLSHAPTFAQTAGVVSFPFDVTHYDATLEPNLQERTIRGEVSIELTSRRAALSTIELDATELVVESVADGATPQTFELKEAKLVIRLARPLAPGERRTLRIVYHCKPARGVRFFPEEIYTLYTTHRWMPCQFHPSDKATFTLRLTLPAAFKVVGNGRLVSQKALPNERSETVWQQTRPMPAYIFGFAAGRYGELVRRRGQTRLRALFRHYTPQQVAQILSDTPVILAFFEERAGVPLPDSEYTQVLPTGRAEQEMSSFTVLTESYGREVLADARENWLAVHEFAHEWWGNSVTCADWSHFWLNEGIASFMTSAYRERRFGREEYEHDIEGYQQAYARLRAAGRDRALAFREAIPESRAGGAIVYDKGALVLNLLRFQIGERAFWQGLRSYTRRHEGASVTTEDLRAAMERASGENLSDFFEHWLYRADVPAITARHFVREGRLVVEIQQEQEAIWPIPLQVAVETSAGRESRRVMLTQRREEFSLPLQGDLRAVRLDDGAHLPLRVRHERPVSMLLYQLAHEPDLSGRFYALNLLETACGGVKTPREAACAPYRAALEARIAGDSSRLLRARAQQALKQAF